MINDQVQVDIKNQIYSGISHFEKLLGVGTNYSPEHVLKCFDINYQVKKENNELDNFNIYIEAKNKLLQFLVSDQMKARRYFKIVSPFENTCPICKGTGEIYKFNIKSILVTCHICGGAKIIKTETEIECDKCHGSGRYISKFKEGGGINVSCLKCGGTKKETTTIVNKCLECNGTGSVRKPILDHTIKSTTPCKHCKQLGFITDKHCESTSSKQLIISKNKPKKQFHKKEIQPANPVLTASLAEKIRDNIFFRSDVI